MAAPLLLDLSHTSHTRARTGIQRVARSLRETLDDGAVPITYDPHGAAWRTLAPWEQANLTATAPAKKRGAQWPLGAKVRGRMQRLLGGAGASLPANAGLLVPEVFSPAVAAALPTLFAATAGPRVALFHDAIALKFPELTPAKTVARFPGYLTELLAFDGIAAVSEDSRTSLLDYWQWLGIRETPPVEAIPLGIDAPGNCPSTEPAGTPVVLSVGSIEGRKNHPALLDACERLWARGLRFELHVIGLAHSQTGAAAVTQLRALQAGGRPLRYDGPVDEAALQAAYARSTFTVYPSLIEGFGLPVLESLARGKPCICSAGGALGEAAREGGCLALPAVDAPALAQAIERLLASPAEREQLRTAARARVFRSWPRYAADLLGWMHTLSRRN